MGDEILYKRVEQEATSVEEGSFMSKSKEGSSKEKSALERMEALEETSSDEEFYDALDTSDSENTAQVAKMQTFKERRKADTPVKTESLPAESDFDDTKRQGSNQTSEGDNIVMFNLHNGNSAEIQKFDCIRHQNGNVIRDIEQLVFAFRETRITADEFVKDVFGSLCLDQILPTLQPLDQVIDTIVNNVEHDIAILAPRVGNSDVTKIILNEVNVNRSVKGFLIRNNVLDTKQDIYEINDNVTILQESSFKIAQERIKGKKSLHNFLRLVQTIGVKIFSQESDSELSYQVPTVLENEDNATWEVTFLYFETAKLIPTIDVLSICPNPLQQLQEIEFYLENGLSHVALELSMDFIDRFGSHLYVGEVLFGRGIQICDILKPKRDDKSDKSTLLQLLNMSMSLQNFHSGSLIAYKEEQFYDSLSAGCFLLGSSEYHELTVPFFKIAISENPNLWEMICSGSLNFSDYVGIWEIVKKQTSCFRNAEQLSEFISASWNDFDSPVQKNVLKFHKEKGTMAKLQSYIRDGIGSNKVLKMLPLVVAEIGSISDKDVKKEFQYLYLLQELIDSASKYSSEDKTAIFIHIMDLLYAFEGLSFGQSKSSLSLAITAFRTFLPEQSRIEKGDGKSNHFSFSKVELALRDIVDRPMILRLHQQYQLDIETKYEINEMLIYVHCVSFIRDAFMSMRNRGNLVSWLLFSKDLLVHCYDFNHLLFEDKFNLEKIEIFIHRIAETSKRLCSPEFEGNGGEANLQAKVFSEIFEVLEKKDRNEYVSCQIINQIRVLLSVPLGIHPHIRKIVFDRDLTISDAKRLLILEADRGTSVTHNCLSWDFFERKPDCFYESMQMQPCQRFDKTTVYDNIPENLMRLLQLMNIVEKYPCKISLQDVQTLPVVSLGKNRDKTVIPWVILRKIISADFSFREGVLGDFNYRYTRTLDDIDIEVTEEAHTQLLLSHPCDVFLAIFLCCDLFLQKTIVSKLSLCQFAIPFIYPQFKDNSLNLSLWSIRDIYVGEDVMPIPASTIKRVSFIRLGELKEQSKSKIINELMRDHSEEHSTFFHHDCALSNTSKDISKGTIEMSWFVPSGNVSQKILQEPFLLFNLRGDASLHKGQIQILTEITDVMVVLSEDDIIIENFDLLSRIHTSTTCILVVTTESLDNEKKKELQRTYLEQKNIDKERTSFVFLFEDKIKKTAVMRRKMLRSEVQKMMSKVNDTRTLEQVCTELDIYIDESDPDCQKGKELANSLFKHIETKTSFITRNELLLLQDDDLLLKWSRLLKETNRSKKDTKSYNTDEPELKEMDSIRRKQIENCKNSNFMADFVETLFKVSENKRVLLFLLEWLKHRFDRMSRTIFPSIEKKLCKAFENSENDQSETNNSKWLQAKTEYKNASFNIEHVFLELSQIYEAFFSQGDKKDTFIREKTFIILSALPTIASDLLLFGHNLQIMDGEASNIPLKWIKSVFEGIQGRKGNIKLSSVSVLGIQSSGKSTLLNSMFGLQFNVSAGPCTRGVYAQLIPVREDSSLQPEYVMVFDTEGLRAPTVSDYHVNHDNELATFVIGLTDFTLLNIKGESISDMKDVLEIVVHALLRLKNANRNLRLNQSCMFIHQNVSAKNAREKMMQGHQETLAILNDITKKIVEEEGIPNIKQFNDVIAHDPVTSVKHIPDLWHGCPPMAPTSTEYCANVMEIVDLIVSTLEKDPNALMVNDTFLRLRDLWSGILKENFVFSFRNSLEVKAYTLFDLEFKRLGWEMEMTKQQWIDSRVKKSLEDSSSKETLNTEVAKLNKEFQRNLNEITNDTKSKLSRFVDKADLKEQMMHWKEYVLRRVDFLKDNLKIDFDKRVQQQENVCLFHLNKRLFIKTNEEIMHKKAQSLAKNLKKKKLTENELGKKFDDMYEECVNDIERQNPSLSVVHEHHFDVIVKEEIQIILGQIYENHSQLLHERLCAIPFAEKDQMKPLHERGKIQVEKIVVLHRTQNVPVQKKTEIMSHILMTLKKTEDRINETLRKENIVGKTEFHSILAFARESLLSYNDREHPLEINIGIDIDILLLISCRCYHAFVCHNKEIAKRYNWRHNLAIHKNKTFKIFKRAVSEKQEDFIAADLLCCVLEEYVISNMKPKLEYRLQEIIMDRYNFSKFSLLKDVITSLSSQADAFTSLMTFVEYPEICMVNFIYSRSIKGFFEIGSKSGSPFIEWATTLINKQFKQFSMAIEGVNVISRHENWIKDVIAVLTSSEMGFSDDQLSEFKTYKIKNISLFQDSMKEQLSERQKVLLEKVCEMKEEDFEWIGQTPYARAFEKLWGCNEKCPWCSEPCRYETKHDVNVKPHSCIQHRPSGICGTMWQDDNKLSIENCNFEVGTTSKKKCGKWCTTCTNEQCEEYHDIQSYNQYMPDWYIEPDTSIERSKFWNWFMCKFSEELADYYGREQGEIPTSWKQISKGEALKSLNNT